MSKCPTFQAAGILGKKWTIVLMQEIALNEGGGSNSIFKRIKKISPKILSRRLKELEELDIIKKDVINNKISIRTKYRLTEKGKELYGITTNIKAWSIKYSKEKLNCDDLTCVECHLY